LNSLRLFGRRLAALQTGVAAGALPVSQVNTSVTRILRAKSLNVCWPRVLCRPKTSDYHGRDGIAKDEMVAPRLFITQVEGGRYGCATSRTARSGEIILW